MDNQSLKNYISKEAKIKEVLKIKVSTQISYEYENWYDFQCLHSYTPLRHKGKGPQ